MIPYFRNKTNTLVFISLQLIMAGLVVLLHHFLFHLAVLQALILYALPLPVMALLAISAWFLCEHLPVASPSQIPLAVAVHLLGTAMILGFWFFISSMYVTLIQDLPKMDTLGGHFREVRLYFLAVGFTLYLVSIIIHYLTLTVQKKNQAELEAARHNLEKTRAELKFLKSAVHPHFLFNSLNLLRPLLRTDPSLAQTTLEHLSEFLLYSLQFSQKEQVQLEDEIQHVEDCLSIEKLRLQERLATRFRIRRDCLCAQVPPLTLLPLVENAVKHGIEKNLKGGTITLSVNCTPGDKVEVKVQNPLPSGSRSRSPGTGMGLYIVRHRLKDFFGNAFVMRTGPRNGNYITTLIFPHREAS